ncbi:MAG TPA: HAMP domain-containing sensor histidine kinase [Myxococcaceae bacterium]|nr:HAMP domain-containing sensor histidine kinase [Myxococcaceae bacterium]
MRLRTLLLLAFALLALLPLAVTVPLASRRIEVTFARELASRADAAVALAASEVERLRSEVEESVSACATDPATEAIALQIESGVPPAADAMRGVAEGRPLTVLTLRDAQGVSRSSAFLPARVGDVEPGLSAVTAGEAAVVVTVEVQTPDGVQLRPAVVAAKAVEASHGAATLVGGRILDDAWVARLSRLTGARVELEGTGLSTAAAGIAEGRTVRRSLPLGPAVLTLAVGSAAVDETRATLLRALLTAGGLGLGLALLAGALFARSITRPVEALTDGVRSVAGGALETRVPVAGSGEVRVLVDAFNRMAEDLGHATRALRAAEQAAAWEGVARSLAHELRNPLTPLQMSLETLLAARKARDPRFEALFVESAPAMLEEVERLRRTIDAFARFARLPAARLEPLDLTAWTEQSVGLAGARPNVSLRWEPGPPLPVHADRDQLAQLLHNLLKNAEEAMPSGGQVTVRTRADGERAVLEVEDTGPGIPAADRARVLEPGVTTKASGTGLGLALAARIAQGHGGTLEIDTAPGGGALLRLRIPRETAGG